jgi:hypothetical protein
MILPGQIERTGHVAGLIFFRTAYIEQYEVLRTVAEGIVHIPAVGLVAEAGLRNN